MIKILSVGLFLFTISMVAQVNPKVLANFKSSSFQKTEQDKSDVTVIFDRTYIDVKDNKVFELYHTVHRKIKINSQYGLEQFNKLYIPTINNNDIKLEFVNCKAKTLKKSNKIVLTTNNNLITTTLPANAPFFYKKDGEVKMLAIKDINVGDEIEYFYTIKRTYDTDYFYNTGSLKYGSANYCLEKSLFINAEKLSVKIWPYNFTDGTTRDSDFSFQEGYKISLNNIEPNTYEIYGKPSLIVPCVYYRIRTTEDVESDDTWEDFAKYFKPKRQDTKKNYVLSGQKIGNKFEEILKKLNQPIEENFYVYDDIKDDVDVAYSYAKVLAKTAEKLGLPLNFHFVKSIDSGELDKTLVSLYQFDNIICSFKDEKGEVNYFPLIEPYSSFNDIRKEFQKTACYTINQDAEGKRSFAFGAIPSFEAGSYKKEVELTLDKKVSDTLKFTVNESLKFSGHSWVEIKPIVSHVLTDSLKVTKRLKSFIENQLVLNAEYDSIYNISYDKNKAGFSIDYQYNLSKEIRSKSAFFSISPKSFFADVFYTPYYLKNERKHKGYFTDEYNTSYTFVFEGDSKWQENKLLQSTVGNSIGSVKSNYTYDGLKLEAHVDFDLIKHDFEVSEWPEVLSLRESMFNFLNSKFYFK